MQDVDVAVIGAGATGAGVARDLALRGLSVALVERSDVAHGTSGRNHGLLHSGGRYAVKDTGAARECIRENTILRRVAAHCIDPCGGMFVSLEGDDRAYADDFERACRAAGIDAQRLGAGEAREREPALHARVREAFLVPDAAVDPFFLCLANVVDAAEHGAVVLTHHELTQVRTTAGEVTAILLRDRLDGEPVELRCRVAVNAAGPWAGKVASLAGLDVALLLSQGTLLVTRERLVRGVVNRCRPPSDGDIIVPGGPVCLLGTTSVTVASPENPLPVEGEADRLVEQGARLVPRLRDARIIREFAGVRPLYQETAATGDGRSVSRGFTVLDHGPRDGLEGFVTVVGGKLTTYRLMAEQVADLVCARLGHDAPCTTAERPLPGSDPAGGEPWPEGMPGWEARAMELRHGSRAAGIAAAERERDAALSGLSRVCLCESVTEAEVRHAIRRLFARSLDDVRRRTRVGMGPCQGATCGPRTAAILAEELHLPPERADRMLREFIEERRRGTRAPVARKGAAQMEFNRSAARGFVGDAGVRS
jgi:glycerol-3-phosphate dehydrogenase